MNWALFLYPSVSSHMINSLFLLLAVVYLWFNYSKVAKLDVYSVMMLLLIASIAMGVHGLSHLGLEKEYGMYFGLKN